MKFKFYFPLLFVVIAFTCKAQFRSSTEVYCYEYDKTDNNGVISKSGTYYYFVNFQNDMMAYWTASNKKDIINNLMRNEDYYSEKVINKLASDYNKWRSSSSGWNPYGQSYTLKIYEYSDKYSTYNKFTYQERYKTSRFSHVDAWGQPEGVWGSPSWGTECYTFSSDMSEMIVWKTTDPSYKKYYKLIDVDSLKPNVDFLYE